jgi:membrane protease subunit HflK
LSHVVGDNTLEETLTIGRERIAQDVNSRLQSYIDLYQTGLVVQQVNIEKTDPPSAVKEAFDDVEAAREEKVKLQNVADPLLLEQLTNRSAQLHSEV